MLLLAVAGVVIVGLNFGPFITSLYCLGLFLGTIYSVPPFRMKQYPIMAFLIIATVSDSLAVWCFHALRFLILSFDQPNKIVFMYLQVRGFLLNYGVYYSTRAALGLNFEWR